MLNKIIKFSLNNRIVVSDRGSIIVIAGTYTAVNMEVVFSRSECPYCCCDDGGKGWL